MIGDRGTPQRLSAKAILLREGDRVFGVLKGCVEGLCQRVVGQYDLYG